MESPQPISDTVVANPTQGSGDEMKKNDKIKKSKSGSGSESESAASQNPNGGVLGAKGSFSWKSEKTQRTYSARLLRALRLNPPSTSSSSSSAPRRGRAVREAADRALAVSARGRTRWSQAILSSRINIKLNLTRRKRKRRERDSGSATAAGVSPGVLLWLKKRRRRRRRKAAVVNYLPGVQSKARFLGRLVPGCNKEPIPVILEEASDYIEALEMQIRAMTALAELLSRSVVPQGASSSTNPAVREDRRGSGDDEEEMST